MIYLTAMQVKLCRRTFRHRQAIEIAVLHNSQRAAVGDDGAERALTADLFPGIPDGQLRTAQIHLGVLVERETVQVKDQIFTGLCGMRSGKINRIGVVRIQRQRAAFFQPVGDGYFKRIRSRVSLTVQHRHEAGQTAVMAGHFGHYIILTHGQIKVCVGAGIVADCASAIFIGVIFRFAAGIAAGFAP